jgi:hypothetical protein
MNTGTDKLDIQILASKHFGEFLQKETDFDVRKITAADESKMKLGFVEIVLIVGLVKTVTDIINSVIKYYDRVKREERIVIVLETGEQIVVSGIREAEQILKKLRGDTQ